MPAALRPMLAYVEPVADPHGAVHAVLQVKAPRALGGAVLAEKRVDLSDDRQVRALLRRAEKGWAGLPADGLQDWDEEALLRRVDEQCAKIAEEQVEETVSLAEQAVPPWPVEVLPGPLGQYAQAVSAAHGCAVDYVGASMLAVASAAIGAARVGRVKARWTEAPLLYMALVGRSGAGKTPALRRVAQPLYALQWEMEAAYRVAHRKHLQAMREWEGKPHTPEETPPEAPNRERLVTVDTTVEVLPRLVRDNPRGLLILRDELTALVHSLDQYKQAGKGADREFFLSAWSGGEYIVDRAAADRDPVMVTGMWLGVVGGLPPTQLRALTDQNSLEDGFLQRLLFTFPADPPRLPWTEKTVPKDLEDAWADTVRKLRRMRAGGKRGRFAPKELPFSEEAQRRWASWYDARLAALATTDEDADLEGVWDKLSAYAVRFAVLLQHLRHLHGRASASEIDAQSLAGAAALVAYYEACARKAYGRLRTRPESDRARRVAAWIARHGGTCSARDLVRANVVGVDRMAVATDLLDELVDRGLGHLFRVKTGGRSRVEFRLGTGTGLDVAPLSTTSPPINTGPEAQPPDTSARTLTAPRDGEVSGLPDSNPTEVVKPA